MTLPIADGKDDEGVAMPTGFRVTVRWGHLDRMPRCEHGRVICRECGL